MPCGNFERQLCVWTCGEELCGLVPSWACLEKPAAIPGWHRGSSRRAFGIIMMMFEDKQMSEFRSNEVT